MKKILFVTCSIILLLQVAADQKYVKEAEYPNAKKLSKIDFSQDDKIAILYSNDQPTLQFYRSYDFKPLFNTNLPRNPAYLETFTNANKQNSILYGSEGAIISQIDYTLTESQAQVTIKTLDNCNLIKVSPSFDSANFAVACRDQTSIIIGNLLKQEDDVTLIDVKFTVEAFRWHPLQKKIALAGTDKTANSFHLIILDTTTKDQIDLSANLQKKIVGIEYSADGLFLAYIQENSQFVTILDLLTKQVDLLIAIESGQLEALKTSGSILSSYDSQSTYTWVFNGENYGKYQSIMRSSGLPRSAGYLYTLNPLNRNVVVSKICPTVNQYFENDQQFCLNCLLPCKTCFRQQNQCSSCIIKFYFDESTLTCDRCMDNCKICNDAQTCTTCMDSYFYNIDEICQLCSDLFDGCILCDIEACSLCMNNEHWILNGEGKCQCMAQFVQFQKNCLACPNHCLKCSDVDTCMTCIAADHVVPVPIEGKCICLNGYFEDVITKKCLNCMTGCASCEKKQVCQKCDQASNWVLDDQFMCQCKAEYTQVDDKCLLCPDYCLVCKDIQNCTTCDPAGHRNPVQGQCVCISGYFEDENFECASCVIGCSSCDNKQTCKKCDETNHWILDTKSTTCTCSSGYIQVKATCTSCSSLIEGCTTCSNESKCSACAEGYNLNNDKCDKIPVDDGISTAVIIIICVAVLLVLGLGSYFVVKMLRKRKGKKVQTLLESEAQAQHEEMN